MSPLLAASCGSCGRSESARVGVALRSACPDGGACPSPAGNVIRCRSAFCCCLPQSSARKGARGAKHRNHLSRSGEDGLRIAPLRQPASNLHLRPDQKHTQTMDVYLPPPARRIKHPEGLIEQRIDRMTPKPKEKKGCSKAVSSVRVHSQPVDQGPWSAARSHQW